VVGFGVDVDGTAEVEVGFGVSVDGVAGDEEVVVA
jgi:hypothetical protein